MAALPTLGLRRRQRNAFIGSTPEYLIWYFQQHYATKYGMDATGFSNGPDLPGHRRTAGDDTPDEIATNPAGLIELLTDPVRRRAWLLAKALETQPLDQALELARTAEAFVTGSPTFEAGETAIPPPSDKRIDPSSARATKPLKTRKFLTQIGRTQARTGLAQLVRSGVTSRNRAGRETFAGGGSL
jgi:hypothetical protein